MRVETITGGYVYIDRIAMIRVKGLPDDKWELHIYPPPGELLNGESMLTEIPVPASEVVRIMRVAPDLFRYSAREMDRLLEQARTEASEAAAQ